MQSRGNSASSELSELDAPDAAPAIRTFKPRWQQRFDVRFGLFLALVSLPILMAVELARLSFEYHQLSQLLNQGALRAPTLLASARFVNDWDSASTDTLSERLRMLRLELENPHANWLGTHTRVLFAHSPEPIRLTLKHPRRNILLAEPRDESKVPVGTRYWQTRAWVNQDRAALTIRVQLVPPYHRIFSTTRFGWFTILVTLMVLTAASMMYLHLRFLHRLQRIRKTAADWTVARFNEPLIDLQTDELGMLARQLNATALALRTRIDASSELAAVSERERLGQELHDSVKQQAFALELQLGAMRAAMAALATSEPQPSEALDSNKHRLSAQSALSEASGLSIELRRDLDKVLTQLRVSNFNSVRASFLDRLREHAETFSRRCNLPVRILGLLDHEPLPESQTFEYCAS
jgi:signal transduction histidine kinase